MCGWRGSLPWIGCVPCSQRSGEGDWHCCSPSPSPAALASWFCETAAGAPVRPCFPWNRNSGWTGCFDTPPSRRCLTMNVEGNQWAGGLGAGTVCCCRHQGGSFGSQGTLEGAPSWTEVRLGVPRTDCMILGELECPQSGSPHWRQSLCFSRTISMEAACSASQSASSHVQEGVGAWKWVEEGISSVCLEMGTSHRLLAERESGDESPGRMWKWG